MYNIMHYTYNIQCPKFKCSNVQGLRFNFQHVTVFYFNVATMLFVFNVQRLNVQLATALLFHQSLSLLLGLERDSINLRC